MNTQPIRILTLPDFYEFLTTIKTLRDQGFIAEPIGHNQIRVSVAVEEIFYEEVM